MTFHLRMIAIEVLVLLFCVCGHIQLLGSVFRGKGSGSGLLPLASLSGTNEPKMEYNRCTSWGRMGSTELVRAQEASRSAVGFVKSGKTSNCE
jgi:hypothetical protein